MNFNFIVKSVIILTLLAGLPYAVYSATVPTLNQQRESILYATLVAMGFEDSTSIVTDNEVIVDYVIRPLQSDVDLVLQLQAIFIASAKIAPDTVLTVIKGRYDTEHPPMMVVAVPNNVIQKLVAEIIDPATFWQMVAINDKTLLDATERQERKGLKSSPKAQKYPALTWRNRLFEITKEETIESVGTITGLGEAAIEQVNEGHHDLFKSLQDTLMAVKIADLLYQADNTEELAMLTPWTTTKTMKRLIQTVYPEAMRPWFEAITRYKVSRGLLPQGATISQRTEELVNKYREGRNSGDTPQQSYQKLLGGNELKTARKELYNALLVSKQLKEAQIDKKISQYLEAKTDAFMRNQLEAEYLKRQFKKRHQDLTDYLWEKRQPELKDIRDMVIALSGQ